MGSWYDVAKIITLSTLNSFPVRETRPEQFHPSTSDWFFLAETPTLGPLMSCVICMDYFGFNITRIVPPLPSLGKN